MTLSPAFSDSDIDNCVSSGDSVRSLNLFRRLGLMDTRSGEDHVSDSVQTVIGGCKYTSAP